MQNNKSLHIWLVLDSRGFGGIESHVEQLALGLKNANTNVTVIFLNKYSSHPLYKRLVYANLDCHVLDGRIFSLWRALKKDQPNIIHTHGYKAGILIRPIARIMNIACVSTFHSGEEKQGRMRLYDWFDRYTAFLASHVYAVSTPILHTLPVSSASLSDNFVNTHLPSFAAGEQIAFVGRLSKEKAPDRFIKLAKYLPHLDFHFYGDGPMRQQLEQTAPANVLFHGLQKEMHQIWPKIGLLIIPSRAEGLPMAALEAMARGIPVSAFNIGALGRLIEHNKNGWLIAQGNITGLAETIRLWREFDSAQHRAFREHAINTIESRYSTTAVLPRLLKDYATFAKCPSH